MTEKLPLGVHHSKGERFRAVITVKRKQYHLGTFDDIKTAERTYAQSKKMVDDLISNIPDTTVQAPVIRYVEVEKPSIWSHLYRKVKGKFSGE